MKIGEAAGLEVFMFGGGEQIIRLFNAIDDHTRVQEAMRASRRAARSIQTRQGRAGR